MADYHFVEEYERYVRALVAKLPIDEAMSQAVGGEYAAIGEIECALLTHFGLKNGMFLVDLGCGSGRLQHALGKRVHIDCLGIDIVQDLLDYAKTKSPSNYRFICNRSLNIPTESESADMISAFSVFTHLLHTESYLYLEDMRRVLKPNGRLIFSFLEFSAAHHWRVFERSVEGQRKSPGILNTFIERSSIEVWCQKLRYSIEAFVDGTEAPWGGRPLWQTTAVLRKS